MRLFNSLFVAAIGQIVLSYGLLGLSPVAAETTTLAVSGADAAGVAGAKFGTVLLGALNSSGQTVFLANLLQGTGGVSAADDQAVWLFDGFTTTLVAREGVGGVPDVAGASFQTFRDAAIDDSGHLVLRADLQIGVGGITSSNQQGLWRYAATDSVIARNGSGSVPGLPGASFSLFPIVLYVAEDGRTAFNGTLAPGGGISSNNNRGVWSYEDGAGVLVARIETTSAPDVAGATFLTLGAPAVNSNDQLALVGSLKVVNDITLENNVGVWRYTGTSGELIARTGVGNVPDLPGENFFAMVDPVLNSSGQIAMGATLATGGAVSTANDRGVWLFTGTSGEMIAREGVGSVPHISGAQFDVFDRPLVNDAGEVLVLADLKQGPGGVIAGDDSGLWLYTQFDRLLARTGSGNVPDMAGASFAELGNVALNDQGHAVLAASLVLGAGGVTDASNDAGIWFFDNLGVGTLVAREGDLLEGRVIESVSFPDGIGGGNRNSRGFNDAGQLVFQATFTNGDSGLFLFTPEVSFAADFDEDSDVDGSDLLIWESGFGATSEASHMQGDANADFAVKGSDFLTWQQQLGSVAPPLAAATAVPEPSRGALLLTFFAIGFASGGRKKRLDPHD